jgi:hypothetical protein
MVPNGTYQYDGVTREYGHRISSILKKHGVRLGCACQHAAIHFRDSSSEIHRAATARGMSAGSSTKKQMLSVILGLT